MFRNHIYCILVFFCLSSCTQKNQYTIILEDANGLQKGNEVLFNGVPVGKISKIKLSPDLRIVLSIALDKDFKLPAGSQFLIQAPLIGSTKLIVQKSQSSRLATNQDTLYGYLDTTHSQKLIQDSTTRKAVNKIVEGFQELIERVKKDTNR